MKKLLTASAISLALSSGAFATEVSTKLQGRFLFEGAGLSQKHIKGADRNLSANKKDFTTYTNAFVGARIEAEKEDLKYGAQIALNASTRGTGSPSYDRSHIFMETDMGKLELGSNFDAATNMRVDALSYARATGDDAENYAFLTVRHAGKDITSVPMFPGNYLSTDSKSLETARKITYYSPDMSGFRFGISYVPDATNFGSSTVRDTEEDKKMQKSFTYGDNTFTDTYAMKDVTSAALTFEHHINDMTSFKLGVSGECGKAAKKGFKGDDPDAATYKMPNLKAYDIGGAITHGAYTFVASYADHGKNGSVEVFGKNREKKLYTAGAVYSQGPVAASVSYYKSEVQGSKMNSVVLGTDYKLAPGLLPYAEITSYSTDGRYLDAGTYKKDKYHGTFGVVGVKLEF